MWRKTLLLLCISSIILTSIQGKKNVTPSTITALDTFKKVSGRIVNGTEAILGQFAQQVSLRRRYSQSHFCGGSILTTKWVLTASHCMFDKDLQQLEPYTILVIAGEIVLKSTNYARQWSEVTKLHVHPDFDLDTLHNDVALLYLKTPFKFDEYVNPVPISPRPMDSGTVCLVSGWGYKKFGQNMVSGTLMYVPLPLLPIEQCRELMANYSEVPTGMFCAGYLEGGRDACQGDSGGGLVCEGLLTGVVSGGEGCAWPKLPGLYADIRVYMPWINQYVNPEKVKLRHNGNGSLTIISSPLFTLICIILYFVVSV